MDIVVLGCNDLNTAHRQFIVQSANRFFVARNYAARKDNNITLTQINIRMITSRNPR